MKRDHQTAKTHSHSRHKQDPYFSQVVGKALDVLDALKRSPVPLSLNDVALKIRGAKTSVFRILRTLEVAGYVEKDEAGRYQLSAEVRALLPGPFLNKLIRTGLPKLKELTREFHETASLAVLFDNHIEVVAVVESPHVIRMGNIVGRIIPPHASSLGKSIVAFQPEERREKLLRTYGLHRFTANTITDQMQLKREYEQVRARGFSADMEENTPDGCCFGAPILREDGNAIAAVSVSMPKSRVRDEMRMIAALQRVARELAEELRKS